MFNLSIRRKKQFNRLLGITVLIVSIAALYAFGIYGLGQVVGTPPGVLRGGDFRFFYTAGQIFLNGQNPYNPEIFSSAFQELTGETVDLTLAYPPQFAPLCMLFALLDYSSARIAFTLLNILAVSCLAFFTMRLVTDAENPRPASFLPVTRWLIPALIVGNPFTANVFWFGQATLIAGAVMVGGWYCARRNKPFLAGLLLGLSTFKPQFFIFPALWLLLDRQWKILAFTGITSLTLSSYFLITLGPIYAIKDWLHALSIYQSASVNTLGSIHVTGVPSALTSLGLNMPETFVLMIGGAALTFLFWLGQSRLCSDDILGILMSIQICLYAHNYDIVLLAPLISALWLHIAHRHKLLAIAAITLLFICLPRQFLRPLNIPILEHLRAILILFAFISLVVLSWQQKKQLEAKII
ncbi:glycosyltransferase family 87 protein [Coleofasciculus chthonoplastes]|uniref:glycosyltransferase family 87 protein n=1 Tax=Coleofasciculus chthonoplastes TaxID=64178 RepID=UPI003304F9C3